MAAAWYDEYMGALVARDKREQANLDLFRHYTKLADRAASLGDIREDNQGTTAPSDPQQKKKHVAEAKESGQLSDQLERTRMDLAEAQRSKEVLQTQLRTKTDAFEKLKIRSEAESKQIQELSTERSSLATRVKDRDAELRGKAKLLEDVQDELVSLHLQLNMAEQQRQKLEQDNEELVERWMARKGQEADAMNEASKF